MQVISKCCVESAFPNDHKYPASELTDNQCASALNNLFISHFPIALLHQFDWNMNKTT